MNIVCGYSGLMLSYVPLMNFGLWGLVGSNPFVGD